VPDYYIPPLRGWRWMVLVPPLSQKYGSHAVSKALRHPKASADEVFSEAAKNEIAFRQITAPSETPTLCG
jgi:hypothetical protein